MIERAIMPDELAQAREIFLTGTAAEVTPVGQIDELRFTPAKSPHADPRLQASHGATAGASGDGGRLTP